MLIGSFNKYFVLAFIIRPIIWFDIFCGCDVIELLISAIGLSNTIDNAIIAKFPPHLPTVAIFYFEIEREKEREIMRERCRLRAIEIELEREREDESEDEWDDESLASFNNSFNDSFESYDSGYQSL